MMNIRLLKSFLWLGLFISTSPLIAQTANLLCSPYIVPKNTTEPVYTKKSKTLKMDLQQEISSYNTSIEIKTEEFVDVDFKDTIVLDFQFFHVGILPESVKIVGTEFVNLEMSVKTDEETNSSLAATSLYAPIISELSTPKSESLSSVGISCLFVLDSDS